MENVSIRSIVINLKPEKLFNRRLQHFIVNIKYIKIIIKLLIKLEHFISDSDI